jgi:hypothetical protein
METPVAEETSTAIGKAAKAKALAIARTSGTKQQR